MRCSSSNDGMKNKIGKWNVILEAGVLERVAWWICFNWRKKRREEGVPQAPSGSSSAGVI